MKTRFQDPKIIIEKIEQSQLMKFLTEKYVPAYNSKQEKD